MLLIECNRRNAHREHVQQGMAEMVQCDKSMRFFSILGIHTDAVSSYVHWIRLSALSLCLVLFHVEFFSRVHCLRVSLWPPYEINRLGE